MAGGISYGDFAARIRRELHGKGWSPSENFSDLGDLAVERTDTAALVTTGRVLVVRRGDGLSKDEVVTLLRGAYRRLESTSPLFPATCTVVLVFTGSTPLDWVVCRTQVGSLLRSAYAVAWAVVLPEERLAVHRGTPVFRSGAEEIRTALASQRQPGEP
ncbi:MAG: hypothetical protein PHZ19_00780 [Candidatus Thermoplasmatota archaeon]|nr:hypothetical protein [Candidatus Thermoplasmatota archaeon]